MRKSTPIVLSATQRQRLEQFITSGTALARHVQHANVILKLAEGWSYPQIAAAFKLSERTIIRLKLRFEAEGLDSVLKDKPRTGAPPKIDGALKAVVIATACSPAPCGHARWTLRLLADRMVELELVEAISPNTVRAILKKTS